MSVGAALDLEGETIKDVRIALGGVSHKPWRASKAELFLIGKEPTQESFVAAANVELANAAPLRDNAFKVELAKRVIVSTLTELAGGRP